MDTYRPGAAETTRSSYQRRFHCAMSPVYVPPDPLGSPASRERHDEQRGNHVADSGRSSTFPCSQSIRRNSVRNHIPTARVPNAPSPLLTTRRTPVTLLAGGLPRTLCPTLTRTRICAFDLLGYGARHWPRALFVGERCTYVTRRRLLFLDNNRWIAGTTCGTTRRRLGDVRMTVTIRQLDKAACPQREPLTAACATIAFTARDDGITPRHLTPAARTSQHFYRVNTLPHEYLDTRVRRRSRIRMNTRCRDARSRLQSSVDGQPTSPA